MIPVVTPSEMAKIDTEASEPISVLIERAGSAVAWHARHMLQGYGKRVTIIAGKGNNGADGIEVPLKQLDSLDLPPPSVIKIDVEDHEVAVLKGGQRLLTENRPAILFESLRGAPLGATFKPFDFLEGLDFQFYVPAWHLGDQEDGFFVSEPSALNLQNRMPQLALLPFERHNRFLLGDNLNILAWPREKEDTLWQLMTS